MSRCVFGCLGAVMITNWYTMCYSLVGMLIVLGPVSCVVLNFDCLVYL